jgi:hypothetical protein
MGLAVGERMQGMGWGAACTSLVVVWLQAVLLVWCSRDGRSSIRVFCISCRAGVADLCGGIGWSCSDNY